MESTAWPSMAMTMSPVVRPPRAAQPAGVMAVTKHAREIGGQFFGDAVFLAEVARVELEGFAFVGCQIGGPLMAGFERHFDEQVGGTAAHRQRHFRADAVLADQGFEQIGLFRARRGDHLAIELEQQVADLQRGLCRLGRRDAPG